MIAEARRRGYTLRSARPAHERPMSKTTPSSAGAKTGRDKLKKELGLWDVYCISTGAMFSSGFFLLPGLATASAGPSTVLAYMLAGLLMIPSMLSMAELSTALPRAGGTYFFLERSLGPAIGTVGGLGTWLALVLKTGFALLGMGAYLAITPGIGHLFHGENADASLWIIKALAVALAVVFAAINIVGAKESSRLQGLLVITLLGILAFFIVQGLWYVCFRQPAGSVSQRFTPFLHEENGVVGMISTVGLVFVSYAGLTKVASVSEEVKRPDRNLPLGMFLSLLTATFVYVVGVFIMIAVLDPQELRRDYTPVATAAEAFFNWLPGSLGVVLIVIAALAAFASTGNAGVLSASRYPLAMARDKLAPPALEKLGRFGTPTAGIVLTTAVMIVFILVLSAAGVAKLASAFNLLVFGMVNLAVIVMRASRIESYDPGFRVPLYPWLPLLGIVISASLIAEMGWLAIGFSLGVIAVGVVWYFYYAYGRVERYGAIYHVFERLGRKRQEGLHTEFREILKEKGLRDEDPFDVVVARAAAFDAQPGQTFETVLRRAAEDLAQRIPLSVEQITAAFKDSGRYGGAPIARGAMLPHFRSAQIEQSEMVLARSVEGVRVSMKIDQLKEPEEGETGSLVHGIFFLVSPEDMPGQHLRILAQIAGRIEDEHFLKDWLEAGDHQKLREVLLRDERFMVLYLGREPATEPLIGRHVRGLDFPEGTVIAMVRRNQDIFVPNADTVLQRGDRLTIIGEPKSIERMYQKYMDAEAEADGNEASDSGEASS